MNWLPDWSISGSHLPLQRRVQWLPRRARADWELPQNWSERRKLQSRVKSKRWRKRMRRRERSAAKRFPSREPVDVIDLRASTKDPTNPLKSFHPEIGQESIQPNFAFLCLPIFALKFECLKFVFFGVPCSATYIFLSFSLNQDWV